VLALPEAQTEQVAEAASALGYAPEIIGAY